MPGSTSVNNFDALRLLAAAAVLISHSYALTGRAEPELAGFSLGTGAVLVFFAISGFLVAQSWQRQPTPKAFAVKRILRIYPALFVVLVLAAFVVGPALTTLSSGAYLSDPLTLTYLPQNLVMLKAQFELPGVFAQNPFPDSANGSLWTLPSEIRAYLIVAALGTLGLLRPKLWPSLAVAVVAGATLLPGAGLVLGDHLLIVTFLAASLLYLWRERIPWRWPIAAALVLGWLVLPDGVGRYVATLAIPYATLMVAYQGPAVLRRLSAPGDFSYGLYLYAFLVQQVIAFLWPGVGTWTMTAVALPVTYLLAAGSWFLIEQPALRLKPRFTAPATRVREQVMA